MERGREGEKEGGKKRERASNFLPLHQMDTCCFTQPYNHNLPFPLIIPPSSPVCLVQYQYFNGAQVEGRCIMKVVHQPTRSGNNDVRMLTQHSLLASAVQPTCMRMCHSSLIFMSIAQMINTCTRTIYMYCMYKCMTYYRLLGRIPHSCALLELFLQSGPNEMNTTPINTHLFTSRSTNHLDGQFSGGH